MTVKKKSNIATWRRTRNKTNLRWAIGLLGL